MRLLVLCFSGVCWERLGECATDVVLLWDGLDGGWESSSGDGGADSDQEPRESYLVPQARSFATALGGMWRVWQEEERVVRTDQRTKGVEGEKQKDVEVAESRVVYPSNE